MKIYTKTGDNGTTSLIGGKRVPKNDIRIIAYGTIDELIAFTGLLRDQIPSEGLKKNLIRIQGELMVCAAQLAADCENCNVKIPKLSEESIVWLETEIDSMEEKIPALKNFILPGGNATVSFCHIARTVCRRAEREAYNLSSINTVSDIVLKYLNRLSDYYFVLSRRLAIENQVIEIQWKPLLD